MDVPRSLSASLGDGDPHVVGLRTRFRASIFSTAGYITEQTGGSVDSQRVVPGVLAAAQPRVDELREAPSDQMLLQRRRGQVRLVYAQAPPQHVPVSIEGVGEFWNKGAFQRRAARLLGWGICAITATSDNNDEWWGEMVCRPLHFQPRSLKHKSITN